MRGDVVSSYSVGLATARSWVRISPVAAVYQCQLSMPSLRGRLMSTSKSWGVNGHTMRCTGPVSVVLCYYAIQITASQFLDNDSLLVCC